MAPRTKKTNPYKQVIKLDDLSTDPSTDTTSSTLILATPTLLKTKDDVVEVPTNS
jgi:hypothetical protein